MKKLIANWRLIVFLVLVAFTFYFLYLVRSVLPTFILAAVLAYLVNPLVNFLEKNNINRIFAIGLIYFSFISLAFTLVVWGFPVIIRELNEFTDAIPVYTSQIRAFIEGFQANYQRIDLPESIRQVIDETINEIEILIMALIRQFADGIISLFSQLLYFVIAPILAFYILKDWELLEKRFFRLIPISWRDHTAQLLGEINVTLKKFIRGHLIVATIVGVITALSLMLLGVEFALTLGLIAGIADLIPYFGPILGAIPAILVGLLESTSLAIKIVLVMLVIQQVESNVIAPKILGDSLGLHPLTIIFVLLAGGHLFGLIGLLLAVPVTAICRTVVVYIFESLAD
jgi:sporulation integral membrane protein YtvI